MHYCIPAVDSSYQGGNIRLVGGSYNWEGRVEILYSGIWSSIYDTSWTFSDATVVCRQLGHSVESMFGRLNFMVCKLTLKGYYFINKV